MKNIFSRFLKKSLRKIISREDHLKAQGLSYRGVERVSCKPFESKSNLPLIFNDLIAYPIHSPHYKIVKNGIVLGSYGVVLTRSLRFVNESTLDAPFAKEHALDFTFSNLDLSISSLVFKRPKNYSVVSMLSFWRGYFHFVLEGLTRLRAIEDYMGSTGEDVLILLEKSAPEWKIRYLEILGYPKDKIIFIGTEIDSFKKIIAPSFSRSAGRTSASDSRWLRKKIIESPYLETKSSVKNSLVYISRRLASKRRVINEEEVLKVLEPLGFKTLTLEEMSVDEQAVALSGAEVIIAPHGAGLTNIIYSQNAKVVELLPTKYQIGCFYRLGTALGFDYIGLQCEDSGEDMIAPIPDIEDALYSFGIANSPAPQLKV